MDTAATPHAPQDTPTRTWLELGEVQRLLLDSYPGVAIGLTLDGLVQWVNPAGSERLGHGREAIAGQPVLGTLVAREEIEQRAAQLGAELGERVAADAGVFSARLRRGQVDEHDWVLRHRDGQPVATRLALGTLRDSHGHVTGLIAVEPWPRAQDEDHLELVTHDNLTGLSTRAVLPDRAEMALQRAARQKSVVAVMLVEILGFEALCEKRGHSVGDDVLRATAGRLYFELRKTDTAVRFDRGQFAVLLVDLRQPEEALAVARKMQSALSQKVNVGVAVLPVAVRIGVAWYPAHGDQLLPLLQAAEGAMVGVADTAGGIGAATA